MSCPAQACPPQLGVRQQRALQIRALQILVTQVDVALVASLPVDLRRRRVFASGGGADRDSTPAQGEAATAMNLSTCAGSVSNAVTRR
jgi:hypothetical protein